MKKQCISYPTKSLLFFQNTVKLPFGFLALKNDSATSIWAIPLMKSLLAIYVRGKSQHLDLNNLVDNISNLLD